MFTRASANWRKLTQAQRDAWESFANANPDRDSLGQPKVLTGASMYIRCSATATALATTVPTLPPALSPDVVTNAPEFFLDVVTAPDQLEFSWTGDPEFDTYKISVTRPLSKGAKPGRGDWRFMDIVVGGDIGPFADGAIYNALFGSLIAGQVLWFKAERAVLGVYLKGGPQILSHVIA